MLFNFWSGTPNQPRLGTWNFSAEFIPKGESWLVDTFVAGFGALLTYMYIANQSMQQSSKCWGVHS